MATKSTKKKATRKKAQISGKAKATSRLRGAKPSAPADDADDEVPTILARETRALSVEISDEEWRAACEGLGSAHQDQAAHEAHAKEVKEEVKARGEEINARIKNLARLVNTRRESRPVECETRAFLERGEAVVVRTDTEVIISRRSLTHEERQKRLLPEDPAPSQAERAREGVKGHVDAYQRGKASKIEVEANGDEELHVNPYASKDGTQADLDGERWLAGFNGSRDPLDGWTAPLAHMEAAWDHGRHGRELKVALRDAELEKPNTPHELASRAAIEAAHAEGVAARGVTSENPHKLKGE